jgi:hypothetical protein
VATKQLPIPMTLDELDLTEDGVAAAIYVEEGEASHAALIVVFNNTVRVFHFFGSVLWEMPEDMVMEGRFVFVKELDFIPSFLIPSFTAHCELIQQEAKPKFGFYYDPRGFYDAEGKFRNPGDFPEYMTCVGFCLTVLQSYLVTEEFLRYADWDQRSYNLDEIRMARHMLRLQKDFPHLKPEDIQKNVRRILPIEYFSGAFAKNRPVPKTFTDETLPILLAEIAQRVA